MSTRKPQPTLKNEAEKYGKELKKRSNLPPLPLPKAKAYLDPVDIEFIESYLNRKEAQAERAVSGYSQELLRKHAALVMPTILYWKSVISAIRWLKHGLAEPINDQSNNQEGQQ